MLVGYYFYDQISGRVCGIGAIDDSNFAVHQAALEFSHPGFDLIMVQADDVTLQTLRETGPQNFTVTGVQLGQVAGPQIQTTDPLPVPAAPVLQALPADQQNLQPIVIDNNNATLESIETQLTSMNATLTAIANYLKELVPAPTTP